MSNTKQLLLAWLIRPVRWLVALLDGEVLDWGVSQEMIESIIGAPLPNRLIKVKDYCTEKGLAFETIKTALQVEIDKLP